MLGADLQNDGNMSNDAPIINGAIAYRNAVRWPGLRDWDARLLKEFRIGKSHAE